jgi:hypothetical protein
MTPEKRNGLSDTTILVLRKTLPLAPEGNGSVRVSDPVENDTDPQARSFGRVDFGDVWTSVSE